jgi:hypothetical protein
MMQAGWDENWIDLDDFKLGLGITLIPFFQRGQ